MPIEKKSDILLNVVLPLFLGFLIYYSASRWAVAAIVRNYLPDGLWAYAFISAMLFIWDRDMPIFWVISLFLLSALFEFLQYRHIIAGTGDVRDVATYYLAFLLAMGLNPVFKTIQTPNK